MALDKQEKDYVRRNKNYMLNNLMRQKQEDLTPQKSESASESSDSENSKRKSKKFPPTSGA